MSLARSKRTSHPLLSRILLARNINTILGGPFVAPWEVDELDDETIDACNALLFDLPEVSQAQNQIEDIFRRWRERHPTYRK